jgi:lysophospholipase L1-like esterase
MSSVTIPYNDSSIGVYEAHTTFGLPCHVITEFVCHGNSLVAKINFGSTGAYTYYVDGVERTITDGTFSNNVLTELFTHGESDGDHTIYIPDTNYVATTNSYTVTSAGVASFRKTDKWGEVAAIVVDPGLAGQAISLPAYVTDDGSGQAKGLSGTYGNYKPNMGSSFRYVGTLSTIRMLASLANISGGKIALHKDGVYQSTLDAGGASFVPDASRLHTLFTGLDESTSHEWRITFACADISVRAIMAGGTAGAGTFSHSPSFLPIKKVLLISDSTSTEYGLTDFTEAWPWLAFIVGSYYCSLALAAIGGTSVRDYTGDGAPRNTDPLFTTSSAEYLTEHTYKSFATAPDVWVLSDGANDNCSGANFTTSVDNIVDDLVGAFASAKGVLQKGCTADAYDTNLANSQAYAASTYPTRTVRLGRRATGITKQDGIHPDAAGSITIANDFLSQQGDLLASTDTTPPTVTSASVDVTGLILTVIHSEKVQGVADAIGNSDYRTTGFHFLNSIGITTADYITYHIPIEQVYQSQTLTLRYLDADGYVSDDPAGNLMISFSGLSITNNSTVSNAGGGSGSLLGKTLSLIG